MRILKAFLLIGFLLVICSTLTTEGVSRSTSLQCLLIYVLLLGAVFFKDLKTSGSPKTKQKRESITKIIPHQKRPLKNGIYTTLSYQSRDTRFVEQAKAYAQRRGKLTIHVPFQSYYSTYGDMSDAQLRWYFYWRAQVRQNNYPDTSLSYIFVHVYELINNVGVANAGDGLRQLRDLWLNYRERYPRLDFYLVDWLLDYAVINLPSLNPTDILDDPQLLIAFSKQMPDFVLSKFLNRSLNELPLCVLDGLTDYQIQESKFYRNGYSQVIDDTFRRVLLNVDSYLRQQHGQGIFEHLRPKNKETIHREPFRGAIYDGDTTPIEIVSVYPYSSHPPFQKLLLGIVKYTENSLRQRLGFRGRLQVPNIPKGVMTVINQTLSTMAQVSPEVAEFDIEIGPTDQSRAVAIPHPRDLPKYEESKLRILSKQYLDEAKQFASRVEQLARPVPLESPFTAYCHDYRDLSLGQQKWYFYWRSQIRKEKYLPTDLAYIVMHAVELIHLVGAMDTIDAYQQLRALWLHYHEQHARIEPYLIGWMVSFASVHKCGVTPQEILTQSEAYQYAVKVAPDILLVHHLANSSLQDVKLDLLNQFVDHDIQRSSFYTAGHEELIQHTIPTVLHALNNHVTRQKSKSLFDIFQTPYVVVEVKDCWRAKQTFVQWPTQIHFSNVPAYSQQPKLRRILTDIVKYSENKLRDAKGHRGRLRIDGMNKHLASVIDQLIEQNTQTAYPGWSTLKIEIDLSRVERLRAESDEVLEMLRTDKDTDIESASRATGLVNKEEIAPFSLSLNPTELPIPVSEFDSEAEVWSEFAARLADHQMKVLEAILTGDDPVSTINEIAVAHFLMPTILVDGINELAQDLIGDILIEIEPLPHLIDDYYEPMVMKIVASSRSR